MTYAMFAQVPLDKTSQMAKPNIYGVEKYVPIREEGSEYLQIIIQSTTSSKDFVALGKLLQLSGIQSPLCDMVILASVP